MKLPSTFQDIIDTDDQIGELTSQKVISVEDVETFKLLKNKRIRLTRMAQIHLQPQGQGKS